MKFDVCKFNKFQLMWCLQSLGGNASWKLAKSSIETPPRVYKIKRNPFTISYFVKFYFFLKFV